MLDKDTDNEPDKDILPSAPLSLGKETDLYFPLKQPLAPSLELSDTLPPVFSDETFAPYVPSSAPSSRGLPGGSGRLRQRRCFPAPQHSVCPRLASPAAAAAPSGAWQGRSSSSGSSPSPGGPGSPRAGTHGHLPSVSRASQLSPRMFSQRTFLIHETELCFKFVSGFHQEKALQQNEGEIITITKNWMIKKVGQGNQMK